MVKEKWNVKSFAIRSATSRYSAWAWLGIIVGIFIVLIGLLLLIPSLFALQWVSALIGIVIVVVGVSIFYASNLARKAIKKGTENLIKKAK